MTANPWLIPITTLRRNVGSRRREDRTGRIGELTVAGSVVPAEAEVRAVAVLDSIGGGIEVIAEVFAPWRGECRRCLRPLSGVLRCDVRELYQPRAPGQTAETDEETYPLVGDFLDLRPLVRDALLLELPIAPVCVADCQGLCPTCGAELNDGPCDCRAVGDPRWGALDILRDRPETG